MRRLQRPGSVYDCGCADIACGDCDCNGNQLTPLACAAACISDVDNDGVCDYLDDCIGIVDEWLATAQGQCMIADVLRFPLGIAISNGNQFDALGVCGKS